MHRTTPPGTDPLRAAFRDLHGRRLYGFALLVTLGDRRRAAAASATALGDGEKRVEELRHPERAAAWLRARVLCLLRGRHNPAGAADRAAALQGLGVEEHVRVGLASLDMIDRAALVLADIERMDARDVATAIGRSGPAVERLLQRARLRFAASAASELPDDQLSSPTVDRIRATAARVMA